MAYTIGIKRRFFGYRYFKVFKHETETSIPSNPDSGSRVEIIPRLLLHCADGKLVIISKIEHKEWFVGNDYDGAQENGELPKDG